MIMGDVTDTLAVLLAAGGLDYGLLTEDERDQEDISRLSYTEHDMLVMRQWEGVAGPAKRLCKFLQDDKNAWPYLTFEFRLAIQETSAPTVAIFSDTSRMDRTKDLRSRGERTVLIRRSGVEVSSEDAKNYTLVEEMDPSVEKYCDLYSEDLSQRMGLNADYLPTSLTNHVLMNLLFGYEKRIVYSGLLTEKQYVRAKRSKWLCELDYYLTILQL